MKVLIAPDSFKGSLSAPEVAALVEAGFSEVFPDWEYVLAPVADGGEGTVAALVTACGGRIVDYEVTGPLGERRDAFFGLLGNGRTAVIEMAAASGIAQVEPQHRDPMRATTFGVGELIKAALDAGARHLIVGIGGSATNDGGAGALQALGVRLLDGDGNQIGQGGGELGSIARIDISGIDPRLAECTIEIASDVDNPLVGFNGATRVFGPQKGATPEMIGELEKNLEHFAARIKADLHVDVANIPGGGAAGGLGAAMIAFLDARIRPGAEIVACAVGLDALIKDSDLVITGEGRIDSQTVRGKTPIAVSRTAARYGKPVIALCGSIGGGSELVFAEGIDAMFSVISGVSTFDEALLEARDNVKAAARNVAAALKIGGMVTTDRDARTSPAEGVEHRDETRPASV